MVEHLKVFMSQPLFNISFAPSEVVVHHKHLRHKYQNIKKFFSFTNLAENLAEVNSPFNSNIHG